MYSGSLRSSRQHKLYAIKRTKRPFQGLKPRTRYSEEAYLLKSLTMLKNSHIVKFIDSWDSTGHLYIATEYCEKGNLDAFLSERGNISRLDEWRIWKILLELTLALECIHSQYIVHLDIKPANVFITKYGRIKIGDFGLATKLPVPAGFEREGDREYIAPEVLESHEYSTAADIFSLGLLMLEMAANIMLPHNGVHWQKLRSGDLSAVINFSSSSTDEETEIEEEPPHRITRSRRPRPQPPTFMTDNSLFRTIEWMVSPDPNDRPTATQILASEEVEYVHAHRRAGAVVYEGEYGPI